ncbi:flippase-like domain-containing protein [Candidatus Saccharibacteria bacterium]|nr:flippase-like domain-containing protein [Candidatus Saccharibacteria bacterium]
MKKDSTKKEKEIRKSSIKSLTISISLFLALLFLTFWLIFKDQDIGAIFDVAKSANFWWILAGLLLMVGYFLVQSWNVKSILNSLGEKISLKKMFKFTLIEFFFCAMTPSATGGQPLEIYYMSKEGISASKATLAIFVQLCGYQIAVMTLAIFSVLFLPYQLPPGVFMFFTIGLLINGIALLVLLTCVFFPKITRFVAQGYIALLRKAHYKKVDQTEEKLMSGIEQYATNADYIKKHKKQFLIAIGRVFLQVGIYYIVPFCVYKAFGLSEHNVFELFAMQSVLFIATAGFPIPGAVGLSESVFLALYGIAFGVEMISSAMLLHRGITFYGFVIISALVVIGNIIFLKLRERKSQSEDSQSEENQSEAKNA